MFSDEYMLFRDEKGKGCQSLLHVAFFPKHVAPRVSTGNDRPGKGFQNLNLALFPFSIKANLSIGN